MLLYGGMPGHIRGFRDNGPWVRAGWYAAGAALLGVAAYCGFTITPAPRGEAVTVSQVLRLAGASVSLLGATALFVTASMPRPIYTPRPHGPTRQCVRWGRRCLTVASLLLCLVAATLWVRSYGGSDYLTRSQLLDATPLAITSRLHRVSWTRGGIRLAVVDQTVYPEGASAAQMPPRGTTMWGWGRLGPGHVGWDSAVTSARPSLLNRLGFAAYETGSGASFYDERERGIAVPAWLPVVVLAVVPLNALRHSAAATMRRRAGRCVECGYDLRASTGRCSECGVQVTPA
jgi:hypothetical protein